MNELSREKAIERTSLLNIIVNVVLAALKVVIGVVTSSIAFVTEGVNNGTDALTSLLTLVGTRLAGKHPDEKHPFGYGRIEYLTGLIVAGIILFSGIEMLRSGIDLVLHPQEIAVSTLSLVLIAISAVVKFILGTRTIRVGRKVGSSALEGVGLECRNDSFISILTIVSSLVWLFLGYNVDAYAGILISVIIIKAGVETLMGTVNELLGRPGDEELVKELYKEVRATEGIVNAADMMLHNYGPDRWSGSVNVEMDHKLTVEEAYRILHKLQLRIMHEKKVTMVFGIYAVDNDSEVSRELRKTIAEFVRAQEHVKSYHAVYLEPGTEKIYCDLVVDYKLKDWEELKRQFLAYMEGKYPGKEIELTVETEYV